MNHTTMRALIVDDNANNLYLLRAILEGHGFIVEEAAHGGEALRIARQSPPQLIISDLLMPIMDGYALLREWKNDERLKAIPFIVYTATYTDQQDERLAIELGADAYILKPAEPGPFLVRIEGVLSQQLRQDVALSRTPDEDENLLLTEYNHVLVRKLEQKATQLAETNRTLKHDIVRREKAEADIASLLADSGRARAALLSIIEDQREAEIALRASEEKFRTIIESSPIALAMNDEFGNVILLNRKFVETFGYTRDEIPTLDEWWPLACPDPVYRQMVADTWLAAVAKAKKNNTDFEPLEFHMACKDGGVRDILFSMSPIGPANLVIFYDITDRNLGNAERIASEQRYRMLFERAPNGIMIINPEHVYIDANPRACQNLGYARDELIGMPAANLAHESEHADVAPTLQSVVAEANYQGEWQLVRKDGSVFPADISVALMPDGNFLVMSQDITGRKMADEALRDSRIRLEGLTRRLLEVQETERRAIARELHDEVGGVLTAVKLNLHAVSRGHPGEAALADALSLVDGAIQSVRSLSLDLRPSVLDDLGLIPALKWYCDRQASRADIAIALNLDAIDLKSSPHLESACFRIVQESITNVLRHANAKQINVTLHRDSDGFVLTVADDGVGFDVKAAEKSARAGESSGLQGMAERATLLGGHLSIKSKPGGGTRVRAQFLTPEGADA